MLETTRATRFLPGSNVKGEVVGANWRFLLPALHHDRIVSFGRPGHATLAGLEAACEELVVIEEGAPASAPDRSADVVLVQGRGVPVHEIQRVLSTAEPSEDQLEVGSAALQEILRAETGDTSLSSAA